MYGSSLRMETRRLRALRMRPTLAAVMPLPSEEVTPPVTKTYFAMGVILRGFFQGFRFRPLPSNRRARIKLAATPPVVGRRAPPPRPRDRRRMGGRPGAA